MREELNLVVPEEDSTNKISLKLLLIEKLISCMSLEEMELIEELQFYHNKLKKGNYKSALSVFQRLLIMIFPLSTNPLGFKLLSPRVLELSGLHMCRVGELIMVWVLSGWWVEMQDSLLWLLLMPVEMLIFA